MSNYNLEVLLEKSAKVSLGIRSRQSGITLKEYFLNQKMRVNNIRRSQKAKLNEAINIAYNNIKENSQKTSNVLNKVRITNKAGKNEIRLVSSKGMSFNRVFTNFRKIAADIYKMIQYRCNMVEKLCNEGIKQASRIIKGKSDVKTVNDTKALKVDVKEYIVLLNSSLAEMRDLFKAFYSATR